jgi:hypothetical protein
MLDDQPPKKKTKPNSTIAAVGQSAHIVEQDGYGLHMHPTTSIHISAWPTTLQGKLYRTMWCDLDFSTTDEKKPIYVPYTCFHFWTGPDHLKTNNSLKNYMDCHPSAYLGPHSSTSILMIIRPLKTNSHVAISISADDTNISVRSGRLDIAILKLNNAIRRLEPWFQKWRIKVNTNKCTSTLFSK